VHHKSGRARGFSPPFAPGSHRTCRCERSNAGRWRHWCRQSSSACYRASVSPRSRTCRPPSTDPRRDAQVPLLEPWIVRAHPVRREVSHVPVRLAAAVRVPGRFLDDEVETFLVQLGAPDLPSLCRGVAPRSVESIGDVGDMLPDAPDVDGWDRVRNHARQRSPGTMPRHPRGRPGTRSRGAHAVFVIASQKLSWIPGGTLSEKFNWLALRDFSLAVTHKPSTGKPYRPSNARRRLSRLEVSQRPPPSFCTSL